MRRSLLPVALALLQGCFFSVPTAASDLECAPGEAENNVTETCDPCPAGRYSNNETAGWPTECAVCPAGTNSVQQAAPSIAVCELCAIGKISSDDGSFCKDCAAGQHTVNKTACVACEPGRYAPTPQNDACIPCRAGDHTNAASNATACSSCASGKFSNGALNVACAPCPAGTSSATGSDACTDCAPGRSSGPSPEGAARCSDCAAGKAAAEGRASTCADCEPGRYQSATRMPSCEACRAGTYSPGRGAVSCLLCDATLDSEDGAAACALAAPRRFLDPDAFYADDEEDEDEDGNTDGSGGDGGEGTVGEALSEDGEEESGSSTGTSNNNSSAAADGSAMETMTMSCPEGAECAGGLAMPRPKAGYWVDRSAFRFAGDVYACPRETCLGAAATSVVDDDGITSSSANDNASSSSSSSSCWIEPTTYGDAASSSFSSPSSSSSSFSSSSSSSSSSSPSDSGSLLRCDADALQCKPGARGVLCGACIDGYTFNSALSECAACGDAASVGPVVGAGLVLLLASLGVGIFFLASKEKDDAAEDEDDENEGDDERHGKMKGTKKKKKKKLKRGSGLRGCVGRCAVCAAGWLLALPPVRLLRHMDSGMVKVTFSTMQILSTVSWNLSLRFPAPFSSMLFVLGFLKLDFLSLDCATGRNSFYNRVLVTSVAPLVIAAAIVLVFLARRFSHALRCCSSSSSFSLRAAPRPSFHFQSTVGAAKCVAEDPPYIRRADEDEFVDVTASFAAETAQKKQNAATTISSSSSSNSSNNNYDHRRNGASSAADDSAATARITSQHAWALLLLTYLVLPPVSMVLFQALDCDELRHDGSLFLRADSSVDCAAPSYERFRAVVALLVAVYQSLPLCWLVLLRRVRRRLDPPGWDRSRTVEDVQEQRAGDPALALTAFLWGDYVPHRWYYECIEVGGWAGGWVGGCSRSPFFWCFLVGAFSDAAAFLPLFVFSFFRCTAGSFTWEWCLSWGRVRSGRPSAASCPSSSPFTRARRHPSCEAPPTSFSLSPSTR